MTEDLKALIDKITCRNCAGEGRLASREVTYAGGVDNTRSEMLPLMLCIDCVGTGIAGGDG